MRDSGGRDDRDVPGRRGDLPGQAELDDLTSIGDLVELGDLPAIDVWGEAVRARRVQGDRVTLAIVELAPNSVVPEHRHDAEQLGLCIRGSITFMIEGESRTLGPGGTWRVLGNRLHGARVGPEGAVVIDVFSPIRGDWDRFPLLSRVPPLWPGETKERS